MIKDFYNCPVFDGIDGTAAHLCEKIGIFDHQCERIQKISFLSGDTAKNRLVFNTLLMKGGVNSQN